MLRTRLSSSAGQVAAEYVGGLLLTEPGKPDREVHDAKCDNDLPADLQRDEGDRPGGGDPEADAVYDNLGQVFDYYSTTFGRESYDNSGAQLIASINFCEKPGTPLRNAYWNGSQMVFGDGYASSLDSGIPNHAYYLMVKAIGRDAAEAIVYRALTEELDAHSGFEDFRTASLDVARKLWGEDSPEYRGTNESFAAVGLDGTWEAPAVEGC